MVDRRREVGACGNRCAACLDYRVLVDGGDDLRRQAAAAIRADLARDVPVEQVGCRGCWGDLHTPWAASLDCRIRQCVEAKGLTTCADCAGFACSVYLEQFAVDSDQARNIGAIIEVGLDAWVAQ